MAFFYSNLGTCRINYCQSYDPASQLLNYFLQQPTCSGPSSYHPTPIYSSAQSTCSASPLGGRVSYSTCHSPRYTNLYSSNIPSYTSCNSGLYGMPRARRCSSDLNPVSQFLSGMITLVGGLYLVSALSSRISPYRPYYY